MKPLSKTLVFALMVAFAICGYVGYYMITSPYFGNAATAKPGVIAGVEMHIHPGGAAAVQPGQQLYKLMIQLSRGSGADLAPPQIAFDSDNTVVLAKSRLGLVQGASTKTNDYLNVSWDTPGSFRFPVFLKVPEKSAGPCWWFSATLYIDGANALPVTKCIPYPTG